MAKRDRDEKSSSSGSEKSGSKTGGTANSGSRNTSSGTNNDRPRNNPYSAPDPVVTASRNNGRGWSENGTPQSLVSVNNGGSYSDTPGRAVAVTPADPDKGVPAKPADPPPAAAPAKHKRVPSGLSFSSIQPVEKVSSAHTAKKPMSTRKVEHELQKKDSKADQRLQQKNTSKPELAKSPKKEVREPMMCKSRPTDNRPKGGGGSGKSFVPWKGTKFGC